MSSEMQMGKENSPYSGNAPADEGMALNASSDKACGAIPTVIAPYEAEWPVLALEDCLDALIDYRGKTPMKTESGVPLVTAKVIKAGRIETPTEFIAHEDFDVWMRRGMPKPGDIVMTTEAPLGEVAQLGHEKVALAQRVITLRGKDGFLDNNYLLYLMMSEDMQEQLKARATGTTVLGIKQSELRKISVKVPPLDIQKSAASTLKALDDRIALLRETNATLEAMAQALFKSWFVDFDPVHANANASTKQMINPASSPSDFVGDPAAPLDSRLRGNDDLLPPELQTLFPATFTASPQGLVPEGWNVSKVDDLLELAYGKALKATDRIDGDIPVYGSGGITGSHNQALVSGPSVIVGRKGTVGSLYWEDRPFFPIDTVFYVKTEKPLSYCFYLLQTLGLHDMNTDGAVPGLNRNNVYRLPVVMPPDAVFNAFDDMAAAIRETIFTNNLQAQTLATLRDTLLPRLISGQLRLPEAEAEAGAGAGAGAGALLTEVV
ncbi:restriction endonuclease subunit S [Iodobacter sp.]|uniref:restriction endonuclease subunit S n=1 Tax=Iodobacter sp. TaxID=1915058 RepID=UPI0025D6349E|nr:restriction endonuclease subunit S [Iodobacter sp.]